MFEIPRARTNTLLKTEENIHRILNTLGLGILLKPKATADARLMEGPGRNKAMRRK